MESKIVNKVGFYSAVFTTILTVITFRIAFMTFPLSGTLCTAGCFSYPFRDIASVSQRFLQRITSIKRLAVQSIYPVVLESYNLE